MAKVTIISGRSETCYEIRDGLGFQALAAQRSTPIEFDCRDADCGICIIKVLEGLENLSAKTKQEEDFLRAMHADANERLACQVRIHGDVKVLVEPP